MLQIDLTKTAKQNLLNLLNRDNGTDFTQSHLLISVPQPHSDPDNPFINSEVTVTALAGSGFYGSVTLQYTRVDLAVLGGELTYTLERNTTLNDIRLAIALSQGVLADELTFDVPDVPVLSYGQSDTTIKLQAKGGSYCYIGQVDIKLINPIPVGARLLEDGSIRILEDGSIRMLESA